METLRYFRKSVYSLMAGVAAMMCGCSKPTAPTPETRSSAPPNETNETGGSEFSAMLPKTGGPAGYTTSESCRKCHEEQHTSWHRTYHRTMTQYATEGAVQADFNNVILTNDGSRFTLNKKGGEFWVKRENLSSTREEERESAEGQIGLVTGSHHMQVFWVPEGHGNLQVGFPFTWLIPEKRWVPRNSTFIRPPEMPHRPEAWNIVCSRCHTTGVEPQVNIAARTAETRVGELGIACEACHGPGEKHVALQTVNAKNITEYIGKVEPGEVVHPKKLTAERSSQVCGFCHSMKWFDTSEQWRETGFKYRPGEDLESTTPIIRPSKVDAIPKLKAYLDRNPEILRDFFWPDGMIRVSGREFNGLIESPCYKGQKFSCLSCHSMHESEPVGLVDAKAIGNGACTQCHEPFKDQLKLASHTRHTAGSSGSECYNCHMPHTTYGVLKGIRSHQISSPRVETELATGRPNACNLCHLDKTLQWTADRLHEWHGQPKPAMRTETNEVANAVKLALSGDAGQRALIAWHLGWEPALKASGTNWVEPVLGALLDDPYAAVRIVAQRAMQRGMQGLPARYDFTTPLSERAPVRQTVWQAWRDREGTKEIPGERLHRLLLTRENGEAQSQLIEPWLRARDTRPMRLRE